MKIHSVNERTDALVAALTDIWEASVRATHTFLTEDDIAALRRYVPGALRAVPHLTVLLDEHDQPAGFCGVDGQRLEMLFLHPDVIGKGAGRLLVQHAFDEYQVNRLRLRSTVIWALCSTTAPIWTSRAARSRCCI